MVVFLVVSFGFYQGSESFLFILHQIQIENEKTTRLKLQIQTYIKTEICLISAADKKSKNHSHREMKRDCLFRLCFYFFTASSNVRANEQKKTYARFLFFETEKTKQKMYKRVVSSITLKVEKTKSEK